MVKNLTEQTLREHCLCQGDFLNIWKDDILLPNGQKASREYIRHPGAVVIVPFLDNGEIVMEEQFRYAPKQVFWELPAGKIDAGETRLHAAQRELLEETGFAAQSWEEVGFFYPAIGYSNEIIHIFKATQLKKVAQQQLDEGEFLNVFSIRPEILLEKIHAGLLTDGKTLATLLRVGLENQK